jgi:hypothetical protein
MRMYAYYCIPTNEYISLILFSFHQPLTRFQTYQFTSVMSVSIKNISIIHLKVNELRENRSNFLDRALKKALKIDVLARERSELKISSPHLVNDKNFNVYNYELTILALTLSPLVLSSYSFYTLQ